MGEQNVVENIHGNYNSTELGQGHFYVMNIVRGSRHGNQIKGKVSLTHET